MKNKIILIGGSCEIIELCQDCGFDILGVVDFSDKEARKYQLHYLGNDEKFLSDADQYKACKLVVGPDDPALREKIVMRYRKAGFTFAQVISSNARISRTAKLEEGVVIQAGCMISAQVSIGVFSRLNIGAHVFHESEIGDYVTLAPGSLVLGRVRIRQKSYIGSRSVVLPETFVGNQAVIGAGSVVTKDVEAGRTVVGVPAKEIKR
ncbi:MAG: NeuD/PglB/VioB family sugar acetyltransferase [Kiritimatiellae bacterium]|nr:NeuD/PglB/VioB family sugar acetyltransferase [Kiritimatiellia bacterium]